MGTVHEVQNEGVEVSERDEVLEFLGISIAEVHRILASGEGAYQQARKRQSGTRIKRYIDRQDAIVAGLRDALREHGFRKEFIEGAEFTVSRKRRLRIIVGTGDDFTGVKGATAHFRNPRRRTVLAKVLRRGATRDLYDKAPDWAVYVLLVRYDVAARVVRAQLSHATAMTGNGRQAVWGHTIHLPPLPLTRTTKKPVATRKSGKAPKAVTVVKKKKSDITRP